MIGKLLSTAIKVVTVPVDIANAGMDVLSGGDGSKASRNDSDNPLSLVEHIRDAAANAAEEIDK